MVRNHALFSSQQGGEGVSQACIAAVLQAHAAAALGLAVVPSCGMMQLL